MLDEIPGNENGDARDHRRRSVAIDPHKGTCHMMYREFQPPARLQPYVRCLWVMQAEDDRASPTNAEAMRIVPDGCPELVLNAGDPFRRVDDGEPRTQPQTLFVGPLSKAMRIVPEGRVDLLGIRFQPAGLRPFLGISVNELTDRDLAVDQLDDRRMRELVPQLHHAVSQTTPAKRRHLVETALQPLDTRTRADLRRTRLAARAADLLQRSSLGVAAVARALETSTRTLERACRTEIGLGPKHLQRIFRLQKVVEIMQDNPGCPWSALAQRVGLADQPHLNREFRLIVGTTPERFQQERTPLGDLLLEGTVSHFSNT